MKRFTHTERIATTKQGIQHHPDTHHADTYQQALETIKDNPHQAHHIATTTLNNTKRTKSPNLKTPPNKGGQKPQLTNSGPQKEG